MIERFKVFISGNQKELKEERFAIRDAIIEDVLLKEHFQPFLFDDLIARGKSPKVTYLKEVEKSDIYILILGYKYGFKDKDGLSPTEQELKRASKLKVKIPEISIKDFLAKTIKVIRKKDGSFIPTNAAVLFFGTNPQEFIPQSELRIARFRGKSRIEFIDSKELQGAIYDILDEVELFFKKNTRLANKIVEFKRVDIPEYPFEAIREAIINAIAHRSYHRGTAIIVSIFDDRVEVDNPGGLLPGLDIKHLEGVHKTRNNVICSIFHETQDMERYGTGVGKMRRLMEEHGLKPPIFFEPGDFFRVTFYGPEDKILDLVPSIPKERQTDLKELGLNDRQIEALRLMVNEEKQFTNARYREIFKVSNQTFVRDMRFMSKLDLVTSEGRGRACKYKAKF